MKLTPEHLRDLYARGTATGSGEHPAAEFLARLVDGNVLAVERERIVAHIAVCSRCAEEVRVARPVRDALAKDDAPVARPAWRRSAILLAAAASLLVAVGLALRIREPRTATEPPYRSSKTPGLHSALAEDVFLRRDEAVLRWTGAPPGATFDVLLANERLDVLARLPGIRISEVAVPASVLSGVPRGAKLVWQVTVVLPDGTRLESRAFSNRVE